MSSDFTFKKTPIDGLLVIEPFVVEDERGYYIKSYERDIFILEYRRYVGPYPMGAYFGGCIFRKENHNQK